MVQIAAANPNLASFEFNWQWVSAIIRKLKRVNSNFTHFLAREPENFNLDVLIGSIFVQREEWINGKSVVIPKRVREGKVENADFFQLFQVLSIIQNGLQIEDKF
jgi:hypothetical protein